MWAAILKVIAEIFIGIFKLDKPERRVVIDERETSIGAGKSDSQLLGELGLHDRTTRGDTIRGTAPRPAWENPEECGGANECD